MSTYKKLTKNPKTGEWERATWLDDCFGNHHYGVVFPSDEAPHLSVADIAYDPREVELETKDEVHEASKETTPDGKVIEKTTHEDGRKDVKIKVNRLDVKDTDPATMAAKEHIQNKVLPKLADADVLVVVVHKPTNVFVQKIVKTPHVRKFAEAVIEKHLERRVRIEGAFEETKADYVVVEHHITNGTVSVTTL